MTNRLFIKIAASLNHRLYPPPEPPQDPGHHVPVQAGEVLLDSGNKGGLCGMGASIGLCFNGALGPKVNWMKIGAAGRPHLLRDVSNRRIQIHPSFKLLSIRQLSFGPQLS
jgi:hypothetical protein